MSESLTGGAPQPDIEQEVVWDETMVAEGQLTLVGIEVGKAASSQVAETGTNNPITVENKNIT